jgi:hypothetical protein
MVILNSAHPLYRNDDRIVKPVRRKPQKIDRNSSFFSFFPGSEKVAPLAAHARNYSKSRGLISK